jgi:hypothetical protein
MDKRLSEYESDLAAEGFLEVAAGAEKSVQGG